MKKTAFISGITGMIGTHFAKALRQEGWQVWGVARHSAASRLAAIPDPNVLRCDILDYGSLENVIKKIQPDLIVHLAAQAFNGTSWESEESTHRTNILGTVNVLRCAHRIVPKAKVMVASSSTVYGSFKTADCPLVEDRPLKPITPYGVSKAATEMLGFQYYNNFGMKVYLPRLFIHVGTGHPPATAIQNFARQVALIKKGRLKPEIRVGNLNTARDFIDVRDGVAAMVLLLNKGQPGDPTNICTGASVKISAVLEKLMQAGKIKAKVIQDPTLKRPGDEPLLVGDNKKILDLGWKRSYSIDQTLETVYQDWLNRI